VTGATEWPETLRVDLGDLSDIAGQVASIVSIVREALVDKPDLCDALGGALRLVREVDRRLDAIANP
jgi:hypothetical protein